MAPHPAWLLVLARLRMAAKLVRKAPSFLVAAAQGMGGAQWRAEVVDTCCAVKALLPSHLQELPDPRADMRPWCTCGCGSPVAGGTSSPSAGRPLAATQGRLRRTWRRSLACSSTWHTETARRATVAQSSSYAIFVASGASGKRAGDTRLLGARRPRAVGQSQGCPRRLALPDLRRRFPHVGPAAAPRIPRCKRLRRGSDVWRAASSSGCHGDGG